MPVDLTRTVTFRLHRHVCSQRPHSLMPYGQAPPCQQAAELAIATLLEHVSFAPPKKKPAPHGTRQCYKTCTAGKDGGKCLKCRASNAERARKNRGNQPRATVKHPSLTTYQRGCPCDECKAINTAKARDYRARIKQAKEQQMKDLLNLAEVLAKDFHEGQLDKIGEPYICHPQRVAAAVAAAGLPDEAIMVAWLHDTVEDTALTLDMISRAGFPDTVRDAVDAISKRKGESFAAYYERVKANTLALSVKWHDVADNADPRRLAKVAPDTQERLRAKYERAVQLLKEK